MNVANAGAFTQLTAAELTAINGSASLFAAVQAAFVAAGGNTVFAFGFGGNTYIADNNQANTTLDQGDGIVKLTGVAVVRPQRHELRPRLSFRERVSITPAVFGRRVLLARRKSNLACDRQHIHLDGVVVGSQRGSYLVDAYDLPL